MESEVSTYLIYRYPHNGPKEWLKRVKDRSVHRDERYNTHSIKWVKVRDRATPLSKEEANKIFSDLIHTQHFGEYNFQILPI